MTNKNKTTSVQYQISPIRGAEQGMHLRMLLVCILLGGLSLFFSSYGITTTFDGVQVDIPWSIILPLFASLVYGARGGLIAGLSGGMWFPFFLWSNNGWANIVTSLVFLANYTVMGYFAAEGERNKTRTKSIFIALGLIVINIAVCFKFIFNAALNYNPAFWTQEAINSMPTQVIHTFIVKDAINFILFTLSADALLHFPPLRRLLSLEINSIYRKNTRIFVSVSLITIATWGIFLALVNALIHGPDDHKQYYFQIILLITIPGGLLVAGAISRYVERFLIVQEELTQNEKKFRNYIEGSPSGVFVTDLDGNFLEVNKSVSEMTGYTSAELLQTSLLEIIDKSSRTTAREQLRSMLTGDKINKEYRYTTKTGETRWWTTSTVRLSEGRSLVFVVDITTIKHAEAVILESESKLRQAEQFAKLGHFEIDLDTWLVNGSPETFRIVGIDTEKQRQYPLREFVSFIHTDEREELVSQFMNAYRTKSPIDFVYRIYGNDGSDKYIHTFAAFRIDGDGGHPRLFGIFQDITAFKRTELELQQSEERFRIINQMVSDWASQYRLNDDGSMTREWIVGTVDKFTGTTVEERDSSGGWHHIVHPDDLEMLKTRNRLAIETGETQTFEYRAMHKDGSIVYLYNKVQPIYDPRTGKATHLIIAGRNITEARKAEEARRMSEKNFKNIFEMAPFCLLVTTTDEGRVVLANRYAYDFYEVTPEEVTTAKEFYYDYSDRIRMAEELQRRGMIENFELRVVTKKGNIKWISMSARLIELNNQPYLLSVQVDIGDQKLAYEQLAEAKFRAEEANKMKSSFLANMSHELRTPLIGIMGYSEIISSLVEDDEIKKMTSTIFSSGERLKTTLNLILDLSKVEANQIEITPVPVDLISEFAGAVKLFEAAAAKKGLWLRTDFSEEKLPVLLDLRLINDIANNLLNNAIKFTKQGGIIVRGRSETKEGKDVICLQVVDTGIGIAPKDQEVIFEDFRQASEGLSRSFEGTGLGLALTKRYVTMMGGSISLQSEPGKGTTFTLCFPRYTRPLD